MREEMLCLCSWTGLCLGIMVLLGLSALGPPPAGNGIVALLALVAAVGTGVVLLLRPEDRLLNFCSMLVTLLLLTEAMTRTVLAQRVLQRLITCAFP